MITLLCLNKKELESFVNSGEYSTFDFLPITKHRALSQIKNEKADDEDVLLTLAFEGEKLAGYLGTFPDRLKQEIKFAWLSTLYVSENFRGKRIAQQLLEKVFEKYDGKIGITEFTKEAESLYNKTKQFHYITPKTGNRYYFKSDLGEIIPRKKKSLMPFKPIFQIADFVANSVISFNNQFTKTHQINFEIKDFVDEASSIFLEQFEKHRTSEEITWIMNNPWVLEGNNVEKDYQFSSYAKEFKYFWVKIFDEYGNIEACSLLNLRDGHLKISYFFGKRKNFVFFLQNFIRDHKVKVLTSYQTELNESFNKKKFPKIHQKDLERRYLFHKKLLEILPEDFEPIFQDGDGDPVFT